MAEKIRVTSASLISILGDCCQNSTHERCGLLAGRDGTITTVLPACNVLASPTTYEIAPQELFTIFRKIRAENLDLLGIYHSHPQTENIPSPKDVAHAYYPDAIYFIISPQSDAPKPIRAFRIRGGNFTELSIEVIS
jgi:[CysO sulfur-carrier protein]-S-L-cysteine hydrolase